MGLFIRWWSLFDSLIEICQLFSYPLPLLCWALDHSIFSYQSTFVTSDSTLLYSIWLPSVCKISVGYVETHTLTYTDPLFQSFAVQWVNAQLQYRSIVWSQQGWKQGLHSRVLMCRDGGELLDPSAPGVGTRTSCFAHWPQILPPKSAHHIDHHIGDSKYLRSVVLGRCVVWWGGVEGRRTRKHVVLRPWHSTEILVRFAGAGDGDDSSRCRGQG